MEQSEISFLNLGFMILKFVRKKFSLSLSP